MKQIAVALFSLVAVTGMGNSSIHRPSNLQSADLRNQLFSRLISVERKRKFPFSLKCDGRTNHQSCISQFQVTLAQFSGGRENLIFEACSNHSHLPCIQIRLPEASGCNSYLQVDLSNLATYFKIRSVRVSKFCVISDPPPEVPLQPRRLPNLN